MNVPRRLRGNIGGCAPAALRGRRATARRATRAAASSRRRAPGRSARRRRAAGTVAAASARALAASASDFTQRGEVVQEARVGHAAASMPSTSTPSREARPATAPSIARRWSPRACDPPAAQAAVPRTTKPSSVRLDVGAEPAQALDDGRDPVGLLEPQLLPRRGRRSRPRRSSRAAPTSGSSSMASGTSSASTTVPHERAAATSRSLTGSRARDLVARLLLEVAEHDRRPCAATMRRKPVRVQFDADVRGRRAASPGRARRRR